MSDGKQSDRDAGQVRDEGNQPDAEHPSPAREGKDHGDAKAGGGDHRRDRRKSCVRQHAAAIQAVSAGIMAAFTIALFVTSILQWRAVSDQADTSRRQLEAAVVVIGFVGPPKIEPGVDQEMTIGFGNSGGGIARDVNISIGTPP